MSVYAYGTAWKATGISAVEKLVLFYIAECAGMDVWVPDPKRLQEFCNCSAREIEVALITLRQDHYLGLRESERGKGLGFFVVIAP